MSTDEAIKVLQDNGAVFMLPETSRHFSLKSAADRLECSVKYLREHLDDFPNAWRLAGGEIRIPAGDLDAAARARRINR